MQLRRRDRHSRATCLILPFSLAVATLIAGCSKTSAPVQAARVPADDNAALVTVAEVVRKPMPLEIRVIGTAEAESTVAVHAQITGAITSVNFIEGDDVAEGQVLFTLDRRPLEATLQQVDANLARDLAQASNARTQAGRYQTLAARGLVSGQEMQASATAAAALEATVEADRAALENAKVQLDYATVKAPISGRTGALIVHPGNLVRANDATPLVVINRIAPINVSFGIPEAQLPAFKRYLADRTLRVEATAPSETVPSMGHITFIDNAVDATTGTIKIKGSFPNADRRLWPGQFVNVVVTLTTDPTAVVVPTAAIQAGQQGDFAFVVKTDQTVELRSVTVDRTSGAEAIVKDGLKPGETVVTDGQLRLVAGTRVKLKSDNARTDSAEVATR
jgi:membrane fusion protein, multidrug efflux system